MQPARESRTERATAVAWIERLALIQGAFWFVTGVWPIVHRASFEAVTGPKTDFWLVETVGALIAVVGFVLLLARTRRRITPEIRLLAAGSAIALAVIDVVYGGTGRISRVYLADAVVELAFAAGWGVVWWLERRSVVR